MAKSTSRFVKHCIKTQLYYSGIDWLGRLKLNISWLVRRCNCNHHYHIQPASNNSQCNPINIKNTLKNIKEYPPTSTNIVNKFCPAQRWLLFYYSLNFQTSKSYKTVIYISHNNVKVDHILIYLIQHLKQSSPSKVHFQFHIFRFYKWPSLYSSITFLLTRNNHQ